MVNPSGIFVKNGFPRIDLFTRTVANGFHLTDEMMISAETHQFGRLGLHLLRNEDVFLLKSITGREADGIDMLDIIRSTGNFDWKRFMSMLLDEEKITGRPYCFMATENLESLSKLSGIRIPVFRRLLTHTTDHAILLTLSKGNWMTVSDVIQGIGNISDAQIRNRLQSLLKDNYIKRDFQKGRLVFRSGNRRKKTL
jgi:hypothetical protein